MDWLEYLPLVRCLEHSRLVSIRLQLFSSELPETSLLVLVGLPTAGSFSVVVVDGESAGPSAGATVVFGWDAPFCFLVCGPMGVVVEELRLRLPSSCPLRFLVFVGLVPDIAS